MTPGDWIAGYAAIVATAAFTWQTLTYWSARRPRLTLRFEPIILVGSRQGERSLLAAYQGEQVPGKLADVKWFFYLRLANDGRSRIQVISIQISQARTTGRREWDASSRLGDVGVWLEPGETLSYRFSDTDLDESSLTEPFRVIVTVSPERQFEITYNILHGKTTAIAISHKRFKEMLMKLGIDESGIYVLETTDIDEPLSS